MSLKSNEFIKSIKAYKAGKSRQSFINNSDKIIKLCSNENPYGSPIKNKNIETILQYAHEYPDIENSNLIEKLSQTFSIDKENLIIGNGSDEILQIAALGYLNKNTSVISSKHSFSQYKFISQLRESPYIEIPLTNHYEHDLEKIAQTCQETPKSCVCLALPNNPTGTSVSAENLEKFLSKIPKTTLIILDGAYNEFDQRTDKPIIPNYLKKYPNILYLQTFSKAYGLAGFRIGYGIASKEIISNLKKVKQPFNVNSLALKAAEIALEDDIFIKKTLANNHLEKQNMYKELAELNIQIIPSHANFICLNLKENAYKITSKLEEKGIIIRHLQSFGLPNYIRVSIGLAKQNQYFITKLKEIYLEK
ncbi:MAG: histidinol-phosphate transaminase [bacterium]